VLRMLDNVLQDFIDHAPASMESAKYSAMRERSVGLGAMGFHSWLQNNGIPFESALARAANLRMFKHLRREADAASQSLTFTPDADGDEGTFRLTVLPPTSAAPARPRDVVLVLDRSGSMGGWKMVAARRAAARIVDTLTKDDRFAVLTFDHTIDRAHAGLAPATDRNRYRAVEHLARVEARGGTEMLAPLTEGLGLLTDKGRDRVLVLVTDGQVGNEDQILARAGKALSGIRVHTVGIDRAVNAGFLGRRGERGQYTEQKEQHPQAPSSRRARQQFHVNLLSSLSMNDNRLYNTNPGQPARAYPSEADTTPNRPPAWRSAKENRKHGGPGDCAGWVQRVRRRRP